MKGHGREIASCDRDSAAPEPDMTLSSVFCGSQLTSSGHCCWPANSLLPEPPGKLCMTVTFVRRRKDTMSIQTQRKGRVKTARNWPSTIQG